MDAETLNCPMCGAAASTDLTHCEHCGARLVAVSCPACCGTMFLGASKCPHCGARARHTELPVEPRKCPRCKVVLKPGKIAGVGMGECPQCAGLWVGIESLRRICAEQEKQSEVLGAATLKPHSEGMKAEEKIRYLPCPVCHVMMNRTNFAHCSNVVVDVCRQHGTWFDKDELQRIVEFIRAGGLEISRAHLMAEVEVKRRRSGTAQAGNVQNIRLDTTVDNVLFWGDGISAAASVLKMYFK